MARRYSRDNSGRFASAGAGATARGGRLKTSAGNKRATVTAKVAGGNPGGTMKGKIKRDPGAMSKVGQNKAAAPKAPSNKIAAAPKPAAPKSTARPLSQREIQSLGLAKSNLSINKQRLAAAREAKAKANGPLEKLKATDRINEYQTNIRESSKKITAINARPAPGRPITGADRSGNRKQLSVPKKSGAIKGSIKRDASASSNLKNKSGLNAGKYKNTYMANANKAAATKRKRKPAAAATAKPSARKADLSPSAFKRRAEVADVRARFAESNAQGLDRANPKNRKAFNRADSMRNAANSYSSILKRSQSSEFSPAHIFNSRQKTSTNPKQTPSEKAAITRANNKMKTFEKNVKAQERARRFR